MKKNQSGINQGSRSNAYSKSKYSNWSVFAPNMSAVEKIYDKYYEEVQNLLDKPGYYEEVIHPEFIMPVTIEDLENQFNKIPEQFNEGIKGIFLLGGSNKQEKINKSRLFCYGCYWLDCIFMLPYSKKKLEGTFISKESPHILNDYKRVGAKVSKTSKGALIEFNNESLRDFYLRDVFVHEIGHHVDKRYSKSLKKQEGFAEWFATEYGFKFINYSDK
jgi:hypothetical protein